MRARTKWGMVPAAAFAALAFGATGAARAATTWHVTTTTDPLTTTCPSTNNCSIRGAIGSASAGDTISIPASPSHYQLSQGPLVVSEPLTIEGASASSTIIDGGGHYRVFDVVAGSATATTTFANLTVTGGAVTVTTPLDGGGGISLNGPTSGGLTLNGVTVAGNTVSGSSPTNSLADNGGGGIFDANDPSPLTLIDSTISGNTVTLDGVTANAGGGGVYAGLAPLTLTGSSVTDNTFSLGSHNPAQNTNGGGGIYQGGTTTKIADSHLDGNSMSSAVGVNLEGGGGIYQHGGTLTVTGSSVDGNTVSLAQLGGDHNGGGGIFTTGSPTTITRSSISRNAVTVTATTDLGGGGVFNYAGTLAVTSSTIAANAVTAAPALPEDGGGGVWSGGPDSYLNSTLSGNRATVNLPLLANGGGALYHLGAGPGSISDTTIADNSTNQNGGGVYAFGGTPISYTFKNTIVADNADRNQPAANCFAPAGAFVSDGFNIDSGDTCNFTALTDHRNADPLLGPLTMNGGTQLTQMPGVGSPAINNGSCTDVGESAVTVDERGQPRPDPSDPSGTCDIGAVETQPAMNTTPPAVSGTGAVDHTLTCSPGVWTNSPTAFTYSWARDGLAISGATSKSYNVQVADQAHFLTCRVTAINADGTSAPATSRGVLVGDVQRLNCPRPSGKLAGTKLGPIALGMTPRQAEKILPMFGPGPYGFINFCLYAGFGIRAATPSHKLLRSLPRALQKHVKGRFVIALTPNQFYAVRGIVPGTRISAAAKKLRLEKPFVIGLNAWYFAPAKSATGVFKVRHGEIFEVGIADRRLTRGSRRSQKRFMQSFTK